MGWKWLCLLVLLLSLGCGSSGTDQIASSDSPSPGSGGSVTSTGGGGTVTSGTGTSFGATSSGSTSSGGTSGGGTPGTGITGTSGDGSTGTSGTGTSGTGGSGGNSGGPSGVASDDSYDSYGNVILDIPSTDGLLLDDGVGATARAESVVSTLGGTATIAASGAFVYRPPLNQTGTDSFRYRLLNGSSATVSVVLIKRVLFVQAGAAPGGSGYQDSPYNSLASAVTAATSSDILFLLSGTSPLAESVALPNTVRLWGQGIALQANRVLIPASSFPRLQGQTALANNNELQGIQFENPAGDSVVANSCQEGVVLNNRFTNLSGSALLLAECSGSFYVTGNTFADDASSDPRDAVSVRQTGVGSVFLELDNNRVTTPDRATSFDNGIRVVHSGSSRLTLLARNNTIEAQGSGISVSLAMAASLTATIANNTFQRCQLEGVAVVAGSDDLHTAASTLTIADNVFTDCLGSGILLRSRGRGTVSQDWTVDSNAIQAGGNFGILIARSASASVRAILTENSIDGARQAAIQATSGTPTGGFAQPLNGRDLLIITNNAITGTSGSGVNLSLVSQSPASLLTGNTSSRPFSLLFRGTTAALGAGNNTVVGAIAVMVETGFNLTYDNLGQSTPVVTFSGGGNVVPGPFP